MTLLLHLLLAIAPVAALIILAMCKSAAIGDSVMDGFFNQQRKEI